MFFDEYRQTEAYCSLGTHHKVPVILVVWQLLLIILNFH